MDSLFRYCLVKYLSSLDRLGERKLIQFLVYPTVFTTIDVVNTFMNVERKFQMINRLSIGHIELFRGIQSKGKT
jgi:hypothetical protein